jgi:hypothetical protein
MSKWIYSSEVKLIGTDRWSISEVVVVVVVVVVVEAVSREIGGTYII